MTLLAAVLIFLGAALLLYMVAWPDEEWYIDDRDHHEIKSLWREDGKRWGGPR